MTYEMPGPTFPFRFPAVISQDDTLENSVTTPWTNYGTSWDTFTGYGATPEVFHCPSSTTGLRYLDTGSTPTGWGTVVWTDYMYVAGLTAKNYGKSIARWGSAVPAGFTNDSHLSDEIVAADMVFFTGGPSFQWDAVERGIASTMHCPASRRSQLSRIFSMATGTLKARAGSTTQRH